MKGLRALIAALCVFVVVSVPRAEASSFGWAGVVIVHGDGSVKVDCVALDRREMTGFRLLRISRFPVRYANFSGFGPGICWIDGEGVKTTDPSDCYSDPSGKFWDYFTQDRGETSPTESATGSIQRKVHRGDIDYWKWNASTFPNPEPPPDALTMKQICHR